MQLNHLSNFNILIVDDERLIRNLVHSVLTSLGFSNITAANSGRAAIALLAEHTFDFIITDWRMNDLNGIDILRHVRASRHKAGYNTPVIMLTGNTEAFYVKEAIIAGVSGYLIKPFSAEQLVKRIRTVIEHPRNFIVSSQFTGPDRRHQQNIPPNGNERRKRKEK